MSFVPDPSASIANASSPITSTALQEAKTLEGQRKVNLIWECTQAAIALTTVISYVALVVKKIEIPRTLDGLLFLVITFYFQRTNHRNIGGVGVTDFQRYFGSR